MLTWTLDPGAVRAWADGALDAARATRDRVDAVNVFPVADADTGTNVVLTLAGGAARLRALAPGAPVAAACAAFADGAARSARGNSGIILGQWLTGFAAGLTAAGPGPDAADVGAALARAARAARGAVPDPQDGTVLTIARDVADHVAGVARGDGPAALAEALDAARGGLARTSATHDVLRAAHVVDAGACALLVVLDVLLHVLRSGRAPAPGALDLTWLPDVGEQAVRDVVPVQGETFEVMVLVRSGAGDDAPDDAGRADLAAALGTVGGSVAVAATTHHLHAHVHTDDPAAALALVPADRRDQAVVRRLDVPVARRGLVVVTPSPGMAAWFATAGAVTLVRDPGADPSTLADEVARAAADTHAASVLVVGVQVHDGVPPSVDGVPLEVLGVPDDGSAVVVCLALLADGHDAATARTALARVSVERAPAGAAAGVGRSVTAAAGAAVARLRRARPGAGALVLVRGEEWETPEADGLVRALEDEGLDVVLAGPSVGGPWWAGLE